MAMNLLSAASGSHTVDPAGRVVPILKVMAIISALLLYACATKRPVLYPNSHFNAVGQIGAERDIDQCIQLAHDYGADTGQGERVAKNTAGGAMVGGAAGGAAGAVWGRPGRGAAAGAAGGAAAAMTRSILNSGDPQPLFRGFVEKCLRDRGYVPIGWK